jgi:hypothetical protein
MDDKYNQYAVWKQELLRILKEKDLYQEYFILKTGDRIGNR